MYERRVERAVAEIEGVTGEAGPAAGLERLASELAQRRGRDDGWLAVFFEFWAHVLRQPQHRERFAALHRRALEPFIRGVEQLARERRVQPPLPPPVMATAHLALGSGMQLERLTRPEEIDVKTVERALLMAWGVTELDEEGASE